MRPEHPFAPNGSLVKFTVKSKSIKKMFKTIYERTFHDTVVKSKIIVRTYRKFNMNFVKSADQIVIEIKVN